MKLVKEHIIFEKFSSEDSDPIKDMGIGMKYQIEKWIYEHIEKPYGKKYIKNIKFNEDLSIDADFCNISFRHFNIIPEYIKFNKIKGDFICCFNDIKTIEENGPKYVGEDYRVFICLPYQKTFAEQDVRKFCNVKGKVIIEYGF